MSDAARMLRFAVEGGRVRRAASAVEQASPQLASALRRAAPFLSSRGVAVALSFARATPVGDLVADLAPPIHATHVMTKPGGARGAVVLDGGALSMILDGVLGGDGRSPPELSPTGLTAPQIALVSRVTDGIVRAFSDVVSRRFGFELQTITPDAEDAMAEGAPIACSLELGGGTSTGHVVLLLPKEALLAGAEASDHPPRATDARVASVLDQVELEVVAELARLRIPLNRLSRLKVGDVIRVDVPVGGAVSVSADGRELMRGQPTTNAGQIAIRIAKRHGD